VLGLTVDSVNVYWVGAGNVMKCAIGGCANSPVTLVTGLSEPWGLTHDLTNLYWTDYAAGTVTRCTK
jgi:hypothetical protein